MHVCLCRKCVVLTAIILQAPADSISRCFNVCFKCCATGHTLKNVACNLCSLGKVGWLVGYITCPVWHLSVFFCCCLMLSVICHAIIQKSISSSFFLLKSSSTCIHSIMEKYKTFTTFIHYSPPCFIPIIYVIERGLSSVSFFPQMSLLQNSRIEISILQTKFAIDNTPVNNQNLMTFDFDACKIQ